jgi:DNA-binding NarL/FixJ family response regulator
LITSRFPGAHIMVVTHHNHPKIRITAHEAGAEGFLLKDDLMQLRSLLTLGADGEEGR